MNIGIRENCIRCGRCVGVCPSQVFCRGQAGSAVEVCNPSMCIVCGHCVAACPVGAVAHEAFPPERVHAVDRGGLPTPEQVELLLAVRRSNRVFAERPVPTELLDRIVAAADRAPTASNARGLEYLVVTDPVQLRRISEYTLAVFGKVAGRLSNPLLKPLLRRIVPDAYRYLPLFERMRSDFEAGTDRILRGARAVLVIHAPKASRFAVEDANLACQNASLMAEALGVSQVYMGFVMTALGQDRDAGLLRMLGLEGRRVGAILALGMPQFQYPNYIDREPAKVTVK